MQSANIPANYVEPFSTHDLSLSKEFAYKRCRFYASVDVNNLTNAQYEVVRGYPMPGINGKVTLKVIVE
jgi:outer membrane receptor protein involved in Fe transport